MTPTIASLVTGEPTNARDVLTQLTDFEGQQAERCAARGIDVTRLEISHVAVRCPTWATYVALREDLAVVATANLENVWNGRPASKIVLS